VWWRVRKRVTGIRGCAKQQSAGRDASVLIGRQSACPQHLNRLGDAVGARLDSRGIGPPIKERRHVVVLW
jgi:hypothetical protein